MYSIVSSKDGAENYELFFTEALGEIMKELKLFQGEKLKFVASKDVNNPCNFNLVAPINAETVKWMGYAAKKMYIRVSVDMVSTQGEIVFKPTLNFHRHNGELITLDVADFGSTNIELVYDRINMKYNFIFNNYELLKHLRDIKNYASRQMEDSQLSEGIDMLIDRASNYEKEDKNVIAICLQGIIKTINLYLLPKKLTSKDKSIQELTSELGNIMLEMKC
ncbi:hypothetical protein ACFC4S_23105 [Priestia megaterium]|uniref:hypothetical protein n=1 Tax=Priestia megaterium TaxID=1404 RepID=UPI0035DD56D1